MKLALVVLLVSCSSPPRPPPPAPHEEIPRSGPRSGPNAVADVLANARREPPAWDGKRIEILGKVIVMGDSPALVDPEDETRGLVVHMNAGAPAPARDHVLVLTCTVRVESGPDHHGVDLLDCL